SEKSEIEGENNEDSKWLRSCLVSISPFLDFVVLAAVQRLVACSKSSKASNNLSIDCLLKVAEDNDYIASIFVLPISSTRKSEASIVDWHCIIVGLSSGHLQFYTERGVLIFSEHVSTHPIKMIRFNSSVCAGNQELAVLAQNRFIVIEGLSLFTTLKTARSSIARGDRTVSELSSTLELNFSVFQPDSLRGLYDFQVVGSVKPSYVETYATAARDSGSNTKVSRSSLPTYSSYFCINKDAFGAFSWHDRNPSTNPLSDAFQTITNQISNAVPLPSFGLRSLLGIGVSRRDLPKKKSAFDASVIRLPIRTMLKDDGRIADRTYFAPEPWNLMAVTDENARILLINTETRRVIRIWKGYRNARCAWVESQGKTSKKTNQVARALFLAIFAPRRGLLEIWLMENGPRVGQFNVDRSGKLLPISSAKDAVLGYQANSFPTNLNSLSALFVSPNGLSLNVPFYLAATDASATVLHDEHLLKEFQLNTLIKKHRLDIQKWLDFVDSLKSISAKKKCVEALWKSDKVDVDCVYEVLEKHKKTWQKPHLHGSKIERSTFDLYLSALASLIRAYSMLKDADDSSSLKEQEISMLNILEDLCLDEEEYESLAIPLLRKNLPSNDMPSRLSLSRFLDQFEIETVPKGTNEPSYQLKNNESDEFALSTLLFFPYILKNGSIDQLFTDILPLLMIPEDKTLDLFCVFWLARWNNDPFIYASRCCLILNRFYQLIIKSPKQVEDRMQSRFYFE
uniref:Rab3-GAP regulatory subunit N-terminal domain-containing protein n=1 Tax=Acrobeloides nanus TaxID=290746 RepID=A0A914CVA2_9BILA